jgi:hypothetical protein
MKCFPRRFLILVVAFAIGISACSNAGKSHLSQPGISQPSSSAAKACDEYLPMDLSSLAIKPASQPELVGAVARTLLHVASPRISRIDECSFRLMGEGIEPMRVLLSGPPDASEFAGIAAPTIRSTEMPMSVSLSAGHLRLQSALWCPQCVGATVIAVYRGGHRQVDVHATPIVAELDFPPDATDRGVLILVSDGAGVVRNAHALGFPSGDFAAG